MAAGPVFVGTPKSWHAALSAANTERIFSSGTLVTLVSGGASGSRIDTIRIIGSATVTAGVVRLWLDDGTNKRLFKEVLVTATTPSTSVETFLQDLTFSDGLVIPNGWTLKVSTHNAENFNVIARGGDF